MSRVAIAVRRSCSNNPTEEITMSTTGSKSSEVEGMGDDGKSTSGGEIECISTRISSRGEEKRIGDGYYPKVTCQCEAFLE
jgi:hypothetical protein